MPVGWTFSAEEYDIYREVVGGLNGPDREVIISSLTQCIDEGVFGYIVMQVKQEDGSIDSRNPNKYWGEFSLICKFGIDQEVESPKCFRSILVAINRASVLNQQFLNEHWVVDVWAHPCVVGTPLGKYLHIASGQYPSAPKPLKSLGNASAPKISC